MIRAKQKRRRLGLQSLETRQMFSGGPYAPAAGQPGSTAISKDNAAIVGWATGFENYVAGANVDVVWRTPEKALGAAVGDNFDIVSLGNGGRITLRFAAPIRDGGGADFAVFENSVTDTFLELAFVEVSSDGTSFFRLPNDSLTAGPVGAFGEVDPTEIDGLAGKYRQGFGTPFDLSVLAGASPLLNVNRVTHVRVVDIVGNGSALDTSGDPVYDPHPTTGSAGFDLEAIGVLRSVSYEQSQVGFEDVGANLIGADHWNGPDPAGQQQPGGFGDTIVVGKFKSANVEFNNIYSLDFESWSGWAYSNETDTTTPDFTNQFSAFAGGGANGSATYAVAFYDLFGVYPPPTMTLTPAVQDRFVRSLKVTNTTYAGLSMENGDSFAKKFGGATGNDPDWFLLTIEGKNSSGVSMGEVEFYLADFRFADNSKDYILDTWADVDVSSLRGAVSFEFSLSSSDVGAFGMNTPAYVAIDSVVLARERLPIEIGAASVSENAGANAVTGRVSRNDADLSSPLTVLLSSSDTTEARVPSSVSIPAGAYFATFAVEAVDDAMTDGAQSVALRATANGYAQGVANLSVTDDDASTLTLTLSAPSASEAAGAGAVTATARRNDANISQPLTVTLSSSDETAARTPASVVILAGRSDAAFAIETIDDDLLDGEQSTTITASRSGYISGAATLAVTDDESRVLTLSINPDHVSEADAPPTGRFEDVGLSLAAEGYWNGSDGAGQFVTDGLRFGNDYFADFDVWSGWAYSNHTDTTTPGFGNQYSAFAIPAGGALGSATFGVAFASPGGFPATIELTPETDTLAFRSLMVANTTYAARSMLDGDPFSKKFGGPSGNDPDWFLLTIEGRDAGGAAVGEVEFYLADYRFADNSLDYALGDWAEVDVSGLVGAASLSFALSSSDNGAFGMNTPAYFAVDNIFLAGPGIAPAAMATVTRNDEDLAAPLEVQIVASDPRQVWAPRTVTIPAGEASASFVIDAIDDNLLDGEQPVSIEASSLGYESDEAEIVIADRELLTVSINVASANENAGDSFAMGTIVRENSDRSQPLVVSLTSNNETAASAPSSIVIPAGAASVSFAIAIPNDMLLDGSHTVQFTAQATGYVGVPATLVIVDNDRVGHNVDSPTDINADGVTSNQDVFLLLSAIRNTAGGGPLFELGIDWEELSQYPDVNDDAHFSNLDVLLTVSAVRAMQDHSRDAGGNEAATFDASAANREAAISIPLDFDEERRTRFKRRW